MMPHWSLPRARASSMAKEDNTVKWFRFYSEAVNDPKVQRLQGDLFKFWVNLLCLANNADTRGTLPQSADDIAWALRLEPDICKTWLHTLQGQGLLDWQDEQKYYRPHNWDERQKASDDVTARVNKYRENRNVSPPPVPENIETLPETEVQRFSNALDKNRLREEKSVTRATRKTLAAHPLPDDFAITPEMRQWAKNEHITEWIDLDKHTRNFIEYWTIGEGAGKCKKNWLLSWQNWVRTEAERAEARGVRRNGAHFSIVGSDSPPEGYSWEKDEAGRWIHLGGDRTGRLPYGAQDAGEVTEKHKARCREEAARRKGGQVA